MFLFYVKLLTQLLHCVFHRRFLLDHSMLFEISHDDKSSVVEEKLLLLVLPDLSWVLFRCIMNTYL